MVLQLSKIHLGARCEQFHSQDLAVESRSPLTSLECSLGGAGLRLLRTEIYLEVLEGLKLCNYQSPD